MTESTVVASTETGTAVASGVQTPLAARVEALYPELFAFFADLHCHPEVGHHEFRTTDRIAEALVGTGFEVRRPEGATGLVAVLRNGEGPVVALRADIDALPIREASGVPYASESASDAGGAGLGGETRAPAMHACGHDFNTTALLAAARLLSDDLDAWSGTVVLLAQPAEELGNGARRIRDTGVLEGLPRPDVVLGQHTGGRPPALFTSRPGTYMAAVRAWNITARGPGGHGSVPHLTVNPLLFAAQLVSRLHAIPATVLSTEERAVVVPTVVRGGTEANIIPDEVTITVAARAFDTEVLDRIEHEILRVTEGLAAAEGVTELVIDQHRTFPLNVNDPDALDAAVQSLEAEFGAGSYAEIPAILGAEDFGEFATYWGAASAYWHFDAGVSPDAAHPEEARRGHSPTFAPDPEVGLRRGARALTAVALRFLGPGAG